MPTPPRKPKFTQETTDEILACMEEGVDVHVAAKVAGVTPTVVLDWLRRGKNPKRPDDAPYAEFYENVLVASAKGEKRLVDDLVASGDWRAKAWLLERMRPERYGNKRKAGVSTKEARLDLRRRELENQLIEARIEAVKKAGKEGEAEELAKLLREAEERRQRVIRDIEETH
jgi:hypothetical protein